MQDIFSLQYANEIQLSPDGKTIVYRTMGFDIMEDKSVGALWMMNADGSNDQKLTSRDQSESSPVWSPNGTQIAFVSASHGIARRPSNLMTKIAHTIAWFEQYR